MRKYLFVGVILLTAVFFTQLASAGIPGLPEDVLVECSGDNDKGEGFVGYGGTCWRLEVKCTGTIYAGAVLELTDATEGSVTWEGYNGGDCGGTQSFDGAKQVAAKCEFPGGGKVQFQAQPADYKHCEES